MELDGISNRLMVIWTPRVDKVFKIGLEGTLRARIEEDIKCNFSELNKKARKTYTLGIDITFTDLMSVEYPR
jgi:hypothetical protein